MRISFPAPALPSLSPFLRRAASRLSAVRPEAACLAVGLAAGAAGFSGAAGRLLPAAPWAPRRVALTFDDGPHPAFTGRILDILRRRRARATFFLVGAPVELHPREAREIARRGSETANHTYSHPNLTRLSRQNLVAELVKARRSLGAAGLKDAGLFRPPGGRLNDGVLEGARAAGYRTALWTVLPRDHDRPSADVIRRRVLSQVTDGGVVLLHSGIESTVEALPGILDELSDRGYRFVTVGELLQDVRSTDPVALWLDARAAPPSPASSNEDLGQGGP
jgi:peptidoglycan-N-acetylglucosamine deacetylase